MLLLRPGRGPEMSFMEVVVLKCVPEPMAPSRGGGCLGGSAGRSSGTRGWAPSRTRAAVGRARSPVSQLHRGGAGNNRSRKSPSLRPITTSAGAGARYESHPCGPGTGSQVWRPLRSPRAGEYCLWIVDQSLGARMAGDFPEERPFVSGSRRPHRRSAPAGSPASPCSRGASCAGGVPGRGKGRDLSHWRPCAEGPRDLH